MSTAEDQRVREAIAQREPYGGYDAHTLINLVRPHLRSNRYRADHVDYDRLAELMDKLDQRLGSIERSTALADSIVILMRDLGISLSFTAEPAVIKRR